MCFGFFSFVCLFVYFVFHLGRGESVLKSFFYADFCCGIVWPGEYLHEKMHQTVMLNYFLSKLLLKQEKSCGVAAIRGKTDTSAAKPNQMCLYDILKNKIQSKAFLSHQSLFFKVLMLSLMVDKHNLAKASLDLF